MEGLGDTNAPPGEVGDASKHGRNCPLGQDQCADCYEQAKNSQGDCTSLNAREAHKKACSGSNARERNQSTKCKPDVLAGRQTAPQRKQCFSPR